MHNTHRPRAPTAQHHHHTRGSEVLNIGSSCDGRQFNSSTHAVLMNSEEPEPLPFPSSPSSLPSLHSLKYRTTVHVMLFNSQLAPVLDRGPQMCFITLHNCNRFYRSHLHFLYCLDTTAWGVCVIYKYIRSIRVRTRLSSVYDGSGEPRRTHFLWRRCRWQVGVRQSRNWERSINFTCLAALLLSN